MSLQISAQSSAFRHKMTSLGLSMPEPVGDGQTAVTQDTAQSLLEQIEALPAEDRTVAVATLKQALSTDLMDVADAVRGLFSERLKIPLPELTPAEVLEAEGHQQSRSTFDHQMKVRTKPHRITKKEAKKTLAEVDKFPPGIRATVTNSISTANKSGDVKLDTDARSVLRKSISSASQNGQIDAARAIAETPATGAAARLSNLLAGGGTFEEILAALLFMVVGQMTEQKHELREERDRLLAEAENRQEVKSAPPEQSAPEPAMSEAFDNIGPSVSDFGKKQLVDSGKALEEVVKQAHYALNFNYDSVEVQDSDDAMVVNTDGHAVLNFQGKHAEGVVSPNEAMGIASKLEELTALGPPADHLMAATITHALLTHPDIRVGRGSNMQPILAWGKKVLKRYGTDVDIHSKLPVPAPGVSSPLAKALMGAEQLPEKFSGFVIDMFTNSERSLEDRLSGLKTVLTVVEKHAAVIHANTAPRQDIPTQSSSTANPSAPQDASAPVDTGAPAEAPEKKTTGRGRRATGKALRDAERALNEMERDLNKAMQALESIFQAIDQTNKATIQNIRA